MKQVAMIPARLNSQRIPRKNLRFLGDKPLLAWVTETVRDAELFDEVYINTESDEIAALAKSLNVKVYRRSSDLAGSDVTSHHFVGDFLNNVECDVLYQVTPTSPFLTRRSLEGAIDSIAAGMETVLSFKQVQAECYSDAATVPINFDPTAPMLPSQELNPVHILCNGIFGWTRKAFFESGCYGGPYLTDALILSNDEAIDIDTEEDFTLAEAVIARRRTGVAVPRYWSSQVHAETNATEVLERDGVKSVQLKRYARIANVHALLATLPTGRSSAWRVVQSASNSATVISQLPGEGNRRHYHPDWDEWWLILEGSYTYEIGDQRFDAVTGDIICIPRGQWHKITAIGATRATRLAVSRDDVAHVYQD